MKVIIAGGWKYTTFKADWDKHGKSAGYIRNSQMSVYANALIAFWDGKSKGTENMIETAKRNGLKVAVFRYREAIEIENGKEVLYCLKV